MPSQCGVRNGYMNPAQLGSDRWAALIGTRALLGHRAALIAVCGTATTIDLLTTDGEFAGGAIMPGLGLMQRVLHEHTAALPDAQGEYLDYPRQTVDGIASGCAHAQAGAIERLYHIHHQKNPDLVCVISGVLHVVSWRHASRSRTATTTTWCSKASTGSLSRSTPPERPGRRRPTRPARPGRTSP